MIPDFIGVYLLLFKSKKVIKKTKQKPDANPYSLKRRILTARMAAEGLPCYVDFIR